MTAAVVGCCGAGSAQAAGSHLHDIVLRDATIYDGSGDAPYVGEIAVDGDRIAYVRRKDSLAKGSMLRGRETVDVHGLAVAPGFVDMMGHSEESLLIDGRAVSGLKQGVTLDVFTEMSMGPWSSKMIAERLKQQGDLRYPIDWSTLGGYLTQLEKHGIAPNVASFVGAGEVRVNILGETAVDPDPDQLAAMRSLVHRAMEEGALGLTTALIYAPMSYAKTPELIALAQESAHCGGMYTAHMRSEGDHIEEAVQETIAIARASGAPAEIHHLKFVGHDNWDKRERVVAMVEEARASGVRITADMYAYTAGGTALDASLPPSVHDGGTEAMVARLEDPVVRTRTLAAMREPHPTDWENLYQSAGPAGVLLLSVKHAQLKPLIGKTILEIAAARGVSPEDAVIDLVIEDEAAAGAAYTIMRESNLPAEMVLPWVSFGSDAESSAPEGVFLLSSTHPRAYGNFARVFAKYVRDEHVITVQEAVRRLTSLPADVLSLADRGRLRRGGFADLVVFDPKTFQDHSTYERPMQFATGVSEVLINGKWALRAGNPTGVATGRVLRGRAWTGVPGGGCRASSSDWRWADQPPSSGR